MTRQLLYAAVPTAFQGNGALDLDSTERIFAHSLQAGVDAIFVNGTTAEFAALTITERRRLLELAVKVAGAERVIAHVGAASPHESRLLAADAAGLGVSALSVLTPFYMTASLSGIRRQLEQITSLVSPADVYLYLFPDRTGAEVLPGEAAKLLDEFDLRGAKVSIAGIDYLAQLIDSLDQPRTVLSGNDGLMREVAAVGGSGVVSGVASAVPAPFVRLRDAMAAGEPAEQDAAAVQVDALVPLLGPSIAVLKQALVEQGIIADAHCRMAIDPPTVADIEQVRQLLTRLAAAPRTN